MHQLQRYISIEPDFFQVLEGEIGEKITGNLGLFVRCVENIKPSRFISSFDTIKIKLLTFKSQTF